MSVPTGVAADNLPFATPAELRSMADIADRLNLLHEEVSDAGSTLYIDDVALYDEAGTRVAVLVWRTEADSFGVRLGGNIEEAN